MAHIVVAYVESEPVSRCVEICKSRSWGDLRRDLPDLGRRRRRKKKLLQKWNVRLCPLMDKICSDSDLRFWFCRARVTISLWKVGTWWPLVAGVKISCVPKTKSTPSATHYSDLLLWHLSFLGIFIIKILSWVLYKMKIIIVCWNYFTYTYTNDYYKIIKNTMSD